MNAQQASQAGQQNNNRVALFVSIVSVVGWLVTLFMIGGLILLMQLNDKTEQLARANTPINLAMPTRTPVPTFTPTHIPTPLATPTPDQFLLDIKAELSEIEAIEAALAQITATPTPQQVQVPPLPQDTPTSMPVLARLPGASSYGIDNYGTSVFDMPGTKAGLLIFGNHNLNGDGVICLSAFPHGDFVAVGQGEMLKIIANDNSRGYDITVPALQYGCVVHPDGLFVAANSEVGALIVPRQELGFVDPFWIVSVGFDQDKASVVGWTGQLFLLADENGNQWVYDVQQPRVAPIMSNRQFEKVLIMEETWVLPFNNQ